MGDLVEETALLGGSFIGGRVPASARKKFFSNPRNLQAYSFKPGRCLGPFFSEKMTNSERIMKSHIGVARREGKRRWGYYSVFVLFFGNKYPIGQHHHHHHHPYNQRICRQGLGFTEREHEALGLIIVCILGFIERDVMKL